MSFQFLCPDGHLLQGEISQIGQQCSCPFCGTILVVPQPTTEQPTQQPTEQPAQPTTQQPAQQPTEPWDQSMDPQDRSDEVFPGVCENPDVLSSPTSETADPSELPGGTSSSEVRVLCPKGHELETPREMLGQDAMCPHCETIFRLRLEDSVEYRQQQAEERERREMKQGKAWLHWSIAIAVAVLFTVILLIYLNVSI